MLLRTWCNQGLKALRLRLWHARLRLLTYLLGRYVEGVRGHAHALHWLWSLENSLLSRLDILVRRWHKPALLFAALRAFHDWLRTADAIWACYICWRDLLPLLLHDLLTRLLLALADGQRVLELFLLWLALLEGALFADLRTWWLLLH